MILNQARYLTRSSKHLIDKALGCLPIWSKASCSPMSGPLILPVRANLMGWKSRFPFLDNAFPVACTEDQDITLDIIRIRISYRDI